MTDSQFQPGQPIPPTQNGGVFGGNPEEVVHDPSMFGPLEQAEPVEQPVPVSPFGGTATVEEPVSVSPFDGYTIPQNTPEAKEVIVEPVEEPVIEPVIEQPTIEPVVEPVEEPVIEPVIEQPTIEPVVEEEPSEEPVGKVLSDVQQKFATLSDNISELNSLLRLKDGEILEIVGANNDKISVLYQFGVNDQHEIHVKRIETDKEDDETIFNELKLGLNPETNLFEIFLDDVLLFEEEDLLEDGKKKSQVIEKLNKFIFLTESKLKDAQKELRAKQEEEEERRRLQDIFRNF